MEYKGFYIDIVPEERLYRRNSEDLEVECPGFRISIFTDEGRTEKFDEITAAVGFEILENSMAEAEQYAKDVIACEEKELFRDSEMGHVV